MRAVIVTTIGSFSADIITKKCRENGIRVIGCDVYPREWAADVENVEAFYQIPCATDADHYIGTMMSLCWEKGAKVVIPLTGVETDAFNLHWNEFSEINIALYMSDKACIGLYRNKMELYCYLGGHMRGTVIPALCLGNADPDEVRYPTVCKPYDGRSSQGLKMVGSRHEMERVLGEADPVDYIVQSMIKENVVTAGVVRSPEQGTYAVTCRRELLRTPNRAGTSVLVFRNRQLEERCRATIGLLGIRGCVSMELIKDRDGTYHMLGYNPRLSGDVKSSCLAGYNCVINYLRCFGGKEIEHDGSVTGMYIARKYEEYIIKVER